MILGQLNNAAVQSTSGFAKMRLWLCSAIIDATVVRSLLGS